MPASVPVAGATWARTRTVLAVDTSPSSEADGSVTVMSRSICDVDCDVPTGPHVRIGFWITFRLPATRLGASQGSPALKLGTERRLLPLARNAVAATRS